MENRCEKDDDCIHSPNIFGFMYMGDVASRCLYNVMAASWWGEQSPFSGGSLMLFLVLLEPVFPKFCCQPWCNFSSRTSCLLVQSKEAVTVFLLLSPGVANYEDNFLTSFFNFKLSAAASSGSKSEQLIFMSFARLPLLPLITWKVLVWVVLYLWKLEEMKS